MMEMVKQIQRLSTRALTTVRMMVRRRRTLYVKIGTDGAVKLGTCSHCVVDEVGRPARSWEPEGDRDLDFARDALIARLASYGIQVEIDQQYVCP